MAVKPTEVKLVLSLLDQEWEDVTDLAKAIITGIDEKRERDDKPFSVVAQFRIGEGLYHKVYGPFSTQGQAEKHGTKLAAPGPEEGRYMITKLLSPKEAEQWE